MTREQLDAIRARVDAALTYEQSEYLPEEGAYVSPATKGEDTEEVMTCPLCNGEGDVEGQRYDAKEAYASTVVAYGIGKGLGLAEEWVEYGPRDTLALLAEVEALRKVIETVRGVAVEESCSCLCECDLSPANDGEHDDECEEERCLRCTFFAAMEGNW